jgi:hypothetical protein
MCTHTHLRRILNVSDVLKKSVATLQNRRCSCIREASQLVLLKKIFSVYYMNYMERKQTNSMAFGP